MNNKKKKPVCIKLSGAIVLCIITFLLGYLLPSVFLLDARIESANEEIASLKDKVSEKEKEVKSLNATVNEKTDDNIVLGEKIEEHIQTIESLKTQIKELEGDVEMAANAAVTGINSASERNTLANTISRLSTTQQLTLLFALFLAFIVVVSVTCILISSRKTRRKKLREKGGDDEEDEDDEETEKPNSDGETIEERREDDKDGIDVPDFGDEDTNHDEKRFPWDKGEETEKSDETDEENGEAEAKYDAALIDRAVDMLYANSLEDNVAKLGGFRFGVTNFEEILSDRAKGKSFGNSEDGDFIAFMGNSGGTKKLYIIPRYLNLSESAVTLRGTTDLFDIVDESGEAVTDGSVKIKSVKSPSVFAFGENGWTIEAKGVIVALGNVRRG